MKVCLLSQSVPMSVWGSCEALLEAMMNVCVFSTAVTVLEELYGVKAKAEDFIPFAGMGEAKFLGGVARKYGTEIDIAATKRRFFEIYLDQAADPDYKIGYPGQKPGCALTSPNKRERFVLASLPHGQVSGKPLFLDWETQQLWLGLLERLSHQMQGLDTQCVYGKCIKHSS